MDFVYFAEHVEGGYEPFRTVIGFFKSLGSAIEGCYKYKRENYPTYFLKDFEIIMGDPEAFELYRATLKSHNIADDQHGGCLEISKHQLKD